MSHRKTDLGIPCPRKICQSSASCCRHSCDGDRSPRSGEGEAGAIGAGAISAPARLSVIGATRLLPRLPFGGLVPRLVIELLICHQPCPVAWSYLDCLLQQWRLGKSQPACCEATSFSPECGLQALTMMKHARGLGSTKCVIGSNSWTRSDHTFP